MEIKVAIIGPVCQDKNKIRGNYQSKLGGVTTYASKVLTKLGAEVTVFGSYGKDKDVSSLECEVIRVSGEGTMKFTNIYPSINLNERIQKAEVPDNIITMDDLSDHDFSDYDYIIYGPLYYNNILKEVFEGLDKYGAKKFLAAQGMIRYLDGDNIVWRNPENVLEVLPYTDYLFIDENESNFISSSQGPQYLKQRGAKNVIVTNGCNGSKLYLDRVYDIKAFKPRIEGNEDWTGAGDSYMAAFLIALGIFNDPRLQGEFAALTATINEECIKVLDKRYVMKRMFFEEINGQNS